MKMHEFLKQEANGRELNFLAHSMVGKFRFTVIQTKFVVGGTGLSTYHIEH